MEKAMQNVVSQNNSAAQPQGNGWSPEEKRQIMEAFAVIVTIQKSYGKEVDAIGMLRAWEFIMAEKYSGDAVVYALKEYLKNRDDIPTPANLIAIIEPPKAKITQAEFIYAQKQHEAEGFPMCGYYGGIIKEYLGQQAEEREAPTYYEILEKRKEPVSLGNILKRIEANDGR